MPGMYLIVIVVVSTTTFKYSNLKRFEYWFSIYRGVATNFSEVHTVNQIPNSFPEEDQFISGSALR